MADIRPFGEHHPQIAEDAYLDPLSCVIGDVHIGSRSSLWPGVVARGDVNRIRIGEHTNIQDGCILHNSHDSRFMPGGSPLLIGNRVTVGHRAILHGCVIGDLSLIGMGAIVMDNSIIEAQVMLAAGALVTSNKLLRSGFLYAGMPARQVRALSDTELEHLAYSADHYVQLAAQHGAALAQKTDLNQ